VLRQGNIPSRSLFLDSNENLSGRHPNQLLSYVLDGAKVAWRVIGSHSAFFAAEHHVRKLLLAVLDRVVAAHDPSRHARHHRQRRRVEAGLPLCRLADFPDALGHSHFASTTLRSSRRMRCPVPLSSRARLPRVLGVDAVYLIAPGHTFPFGEAATQKESVLFSDVPKLPLCLLHP
jgi:hypothetical protein